MRGEYLNQGDTLTPAVGSPPHAWGIRTGSGRWSEMPRITPTCVGNTANNPDKGAVYKDHPHMRGEYYLTCLRLVYMSGSPPHAWGILVMNDDYGINTGITPTCVGNTERTN